MEPAGLGIDWVEDRIVARRPLFRRPLLSALLQLHGRNVASKARRRETLAALWRGFRAVRVLRPSLLRPASHPYP